jgi:hypothetical protein
MDKKQNFASAVEFTKLLQKRVHVNQGGLNVKVIILDVKRSYGNVRYLVTPVEGNGQVWVENIA